MSSAIVVILHGTQDGVLADSDRSALSAATELADDSTIRAVAVGSDSARLCEAALEHGCNEAIAIETDKNLDFFGKASLIAALVQNTDVSWILCGEHLGDDKGSGVSAAIAQLLEVPHLGSVVSAKPIGDGLCIARTTERGIESSETDLCTVLAFVPRENQTSRKRQKGAVIRRVPATELPQASHTIAQRETLAEHYDWSTTRTELLSDPTELLARLQADKLWQP